MLFLTAFAQTAPKAGVARLLYTGKGTFILVLIAFVSLVEKIEFLLLLKLDA